MPRLRAVGQGSSVKSRVRINIVSCRSQPFDGSSTGFPQDGASDASPASSWGSSWRPRCAAQEAPPALFRVFLTDGRVLTAYGEWARLDDRIVFSMPTRRGDFAGELHLVTVPASQVDWERTERYALALRAQSYAATRGEADFARLSDEVARTLNAIATMKDPAERLAHAEAARRTLSTWPGAHFGYRAVEVREILGMLDEVIIDLRSAAGLPGTSLALIAPPPVLPDEPLLPPPTDAEIAEQLLTAADLAATPAERTSLLQSLLGLLDRAASLLPSVVGGLRPQPRRAAARRGATARYRLRAVADHDAGGGRAQRRARGCPRRSRSSAPTVRDADARLGGKRPAEVEGLLATLDVAAGIRAGDATGARPVGAEVP